MQCCQSTIFLGTLQVLTYHSPSKTLANNNNFKSTNVLTESPLVKDAKTVKVLALPKVNGTNAKNGYSKGTC